MFYSCLFLFFFAGKRIRELQLCCKEGKYFSAQAIFPCIRREKRAHILCFRLRGRCIRQSRRSIHLHRFLNCARGRSELAFVCWFRFRWVDLLEFDVLAPLLLEWRFYHLALLEAKARKVDVRCKAEVRRVDEAAAEEFASARDGIDYHIRDFANLAYMAGLVGLEPELDPDSAARRNFG